MGAEEITIETLLAENCFWLVDLKLSTGSTFTGYLVDIKLPVNEEVFFYFLEVHKAKRYLSKYNPTWLMLLPFILITELEPLDFDEISEKLQERRRSFYS